MPLMRFSTSIQMQLLLKILFQLGYGHFRKMQFSLLPKIISRAMLIIWILSIYLHSNKRSVLKIMLLIRKINDWSDLKMLRLVLILNIQTTSHCRYYHNIVRYWWNSKMSLSETKKKISWNFQCKNEFSQNRAWYNYSLDHQFVE